MGLKCRCMHFTIYEIGSKWCGVEWCDGGGGSDGGGGGGWMKRNTTKCCMLWLE